MDIPKQLKDRVKITTDRLYESAPPKIKLLPQAEVCEHCADVVVDRHIDYRKTNHYWQAKCRTCQLYQNPETGEFDMTGTEFRNYWKENKNAK